VVEFMEAGEGCGPLPWQNGGVGELL
jgi:hypothetical protein